MYSLEIPPDSVILWIIVSQSEAIFSGLKAENQRYWWLVLFWNERK
jgi:hypothetical protein